MPTASASTNRVPNMPADGTLLSWKCIPNSMRIRISHLRRIIRETLEEQGWVPGRWYPGSGQPVTDDDVESMGHGGQDVPPDEDRPEDIDDIYVVEDDEAHL